MKIGTKLIVQLPGGWESKYTQFHPGWIQRMNTMNGVHVFVTGGYISVVPGSTSIQCRPANIQPGPNQYTTDIYIPLELLSKVSEEVKGPIAMEIKDVGFCPACNGFRGHKKMCPVERKRSEGSHAKGKEGN